MGDGHEHPTAVWYAAAWDEPARPGAVLIRVSMTKDVEADARVDAVCREPDDACALLRQWLAELTART